MAAIMNMPEPAATQKTHRVRYPNSAPASIEDVMVPAPRVNAAPMKPGPPSFR